MPEKILKLTQEELNVLLQEFFARKEAELAKLSLEQAIKEFCEENNLVAKPEAETKSL